MEKKILLYCWGAMNEPALRRALVKNQRKFVEYNRRMKDYHADSEFAMEFVKMLHREKIQIVLSYDYFPLISILCEMTAKSLLCTQE